MTYKVEDLRTLTADRLLCSLIWRYGIKTFWLDEAEPERHVQDIGTRYGYHDGTDAQVGLAWSRAEQQMVHEGLTKLGHPQDDIFMLSRSFFIGGQRSV